MGSVAAPYAVRGWVHLHVHTETQDSLLDFPLWWLRQAGHWHAYRVLEGRPQGRGLVAHLEGVDDRERALALKGAEVAVSRAELPAPGRDEYYWSDLIGLKVVNSAGEVLGTLDGFLETGAHDVMQVRGEDRERLIPFTAPLVVKVDVPGGVVTVDWGLDY